MENLPEIKDIQLPDGVSVFPLAYGWWVILAGIIFLFILIKLIVWGIKTSRKHYALKKLSQISVDSPVQAAVNISELLRRICIVKYPQASSLYGNEWLQFLSEHTRNTLPEKAAQLLVNAPFMDIHNTTYQQSDAVELKTFCKSWIGDNL